jgi:predicted short-subunit dehydrogenase-like oxidoreductase (DUF2520 family)
MLGTGNIANGFTHLFLKNQFKIDCIFGKSSKNIEKSVLKNTFFTNNISKIPSTSDLYIFALSDDAYQNVFKKISKNNHLVIHTSGSLDSKSLGIVSKRWGCIYPLQSIKKDTKLIWEKVPFFIEAANEKDEKLLSVFCASNNMDFSTLNSSKRKKLHLAAVASNNFIYHLLSMVKEYCIKNEVDFKDLKPLLEKTIEAALNEYPYIEQTGPAVRGDNTLIEKQVKELKKHENLQEIYEVFTKQIIKKHHHEL